MTRNEFFGLVEDACRTEKGILTEDTPLASVEGWDSMAVIGLIAAVDEHLDLVLAASDLLAAETTGDLVDLVCDRLAD